LEVVLVLKPSSKPFAKALPAPGGGYHRQFSLPGLIPDLVKRDGKPEVFEAAAAAHGAAAIALVGKLELRSMHSKRTHDYTRITGAELGVAIVAASLKPADFARLYGVPVSRVMGWIDGVQEIPHSAHVLVKLLADRHNREDAVKITASSTQQDFPMVSDFARWRASLGYNGMQVAKAAELIGVTGSTKLSALNTNKAELSMTERLAMAAVRAGLPAWTPETDEEIADIADLKQILERAEKRRSSSSKKASAA